MDYLGKEWKALSGYLEQMLSTARRKYELGLYPDETIRFQKSYAKVARDFVRTEERLASGLEYLMNLKKGMPREEAIQLFEAPTMIWDLLLFKGIRSLYLSMETNFGKDVAQEILRTNCPTYAQAVISNKTGLQDESSTILRHIEMQAENQYRMKVQDTPTNRLQYAIN